MGSCCRILPRMTRFLMHGHYAGAAVPFNQGPDSMGTRVAKRHRGAARDGVSHRMTDELLLCRWKVPLRCQHPTAPQGGSPLSWRTVAQMCPSRWSSGKLTFAAERTVVGRIACVDVARSCVDAHAVCE